MSSRQHRKRRQASGGVSEQFVLDVINQMGVMQQQALQHAQQSMTQALQAVTATYQNRIETLEQEYQTLKRQLRGLPGPDDGERGRLSAADCPTTPATSIRSCRSRRT